MASYTSYCQAVNSGQFSELHRLYHDLEYGFPLQEDNLLFGRLILEINQAGLSWDTVLKKRNSIQHAYAQFDIATIANFNEEDIEVLMGNPGIIRMGKKIEAIIYNAQQVLKLQATHGSFHNWLDHEHPKTAEEWIKCFKKQFKFTGNEITKEFLLATSYLEGAHDKNCPIYPKTLKAHPKWKEN
jgi:DNA-3-methyladenine glycosylase I